MDLRPDSPRSIGGMLDDSLRLYRLSYAHWWLPSLVIALATLAWGVALATSGVASTDPRAFLAMFASGRIALALVALSFVSLWSAATLYVALDAVYVGAPLSRGQAASAGARLMPAMFGLGIVTALILFLGFIALVIPGIYLLGRLLLANPVLAVERKGVFNALSRSYALTRGSWWRGFTVLSMAFIIVFVLAGVVVGILGVVVALTLRGDPALAGVVNTVLQSLAKFFTSAFIPAATIVLYHDLKARVDGDDLERRAEALAAS